MKQSARRVLFGGRPSLSREIRRIVDAGRIAGFIGDSITNGSSASNSIYAYPRQTIALVGAMRMSYASAVIAGTPGETSAQILVRLPALLAQNVSSVYILAGTNDAGGGVTSAVFSANMAAMIALCNAARVTFYVLTVPPRSAAVATASTRTLTTEYNAWINANAPYVVDAFTALAIGGTGDMIADYDSGDGIHPNDLGHRRIAQAAAAKAFAVGVPTTGIAQFVPESTNLIKNPFMSGGGTVPTTYFEQSGGTGTAPTYSIVNDDSGFLDAGRWAQMDFNAAAGGARTFASSLKTTGWAVGDVLALTGKIQVIDDGGNWESVAAVAHTASVVVRLVNQAAAGISPDIVGSAGLDMGPGWRTVTVPVGTTGMILYCTVTLPTGAHVRVRFGSFAVLNLTALGLVTSMA